MDQSQQGYDGAVRKFTTQHGAQEVFVVFPRFLTGLLDGPEKLPFGEVVWLDTVLPIPTGLADQGYRNIFTGETVVSYKGDGGTVLSLGKIFSSFTWALSEVSP